MENVQRRAARYVLNRPYRRSNPDSVTRMVTELGWDSLQERRHRINLVSFYKMINNHVSIPQEYHPATKPRRHTTRGNSLQFAHQQADIKLFRDSFIPRTIPLWNALPEEVVSAVSVDSFKQRLASTSPA